FTGEEGSEYTGATALNEKYLETDNFINLTHSPNTRLFTGSAATAKYSISTPITKVDATAKKAYRVSITGLHGQDYSDYIRSHPNPIKTLSSLLASCRSSGITLQLAEFSGGTDPASGQKGATFTVLINDTDEAKFLRKVSNSKEDFDDDYSEDEPDLSYHYEETTPPTTVLPDATTETFLGLMYTLEEGVFATSEKDNEGDILAISTLTSLVLDDSAITLTVSGRSIDDKIMEEMNQTFSEIARLSDYDFQTLSTSPLWQPRKENPLADSFTMAAKQADLELTPDTTFMRTECSIFIGKNPSLNLISLGVNIQDALELSKSLVLFLNSQGQETNILN
ncbi:MAG: hypothetical protein RR626_08785, partial [Anaerovoracaceae bacterium]